MKPTRTIHIRPDGVLYDEGDGVLTSASPDSSISGSIEHAKELRKLTLAKIHESWSAVKNAIDIMPANSLVLMLKNLEPLARLSQSLSPIEKSVLLVAVKAELSRMITPYWSDVVIFLVTELIKNPDKSDEFERWVINHFHAAQVQFQFGHRVQRAMTTDSIAPE